MLVLARRTAPRRLLGVPLRRRSLLTLAIESSCDDSAVAVLSRTRRRGTELLFNERVSSDCRAFGGVHPVVAVQGHHASVAPLVRRAVAALPFAEEEEEEEEEDDGPTTIYVPGEDGTLRRRRRPDFVAATRGPGVMANLAVGLSVAKGLALAWDVPLVGVHHMQAHALTPRLAAALASASADNNNNNKDKDKDGGGGGNLHHRPEFPFLTLLVSGGHTQLVHSAGLTDHRILASSADIAVGNLLDQTARAVLPADLIASSPDVMYARLLEPFAFGDGPSGSDPDHRHRAFFRPALSRRDEMHPLPTPYPWTVALPLRDSRRLAYSFSSIHTTVCRIADAIPPDDIAQRRCLARHTLRAAFQHLASRLVLALEDLPALRRSPPSVLVVSGGVASNPFLIHVLRETLSARGFPDLRVLAPPSALCTDNAAMIAWAAMEMFDHGWVSDLAIRPLAKWPMSVDGKDAILAIDGWVSRC